MKKTRYSETQIITILKTVESGRLVKEVCREYGISDATYYNWKAKYGGMEASDVKRMKELEEENRRLKQMYANLSLEHVILKDIISNLFWFENPGAGQMRLPWHIQPKLAMNT